MRDTAKAAENEISRKFYGTDTPAQAKALKTANVPAPAIKSYVEVDGHLIEEEQHAEFVASIKATTQALAEARQFLEV